MVLFAMELDLSLVFATNRIVEAVESVLGEDRCEEKLKEELRLWKTGKRDYLEGYKYCHQEGFIPFDLVVRLHQQFQRTLLGV